MKRQMKNIRLFCLLILAIIGFSNAYGKKFVVVANAPKTITPVFFSSLPGGGDTISISSERILGLKFQEFHGNEFNPLVFINDGGQVNINDQNSWGALTFENCQYIKVTGTGSPDIKYGFKLAAQTSGLTFSEYSSDCEAEFIEIDHDGFFGIYAKKDFGGNPPVPYPVFKNLIIHDMRISNVTEGMYLGETKSPGMEFRHVRVYNNIITNTGREGIQVANMVEDVEVYNNVIINSGLDGDEYQSSNFQIGDNSVGKYYNNIFINAPALGMIVMGSGNIEIFNNYFEDNKGVFIDNRIFTTLCAPISLKNNYFLKTNNSSILTNYNELNPVILAGNQYYGTCPFVSSSTASQNNITISNNQLTSLPKITFADTFNYTVNSNSVYKNIGPVALSGVDGDYDADVSSQIILTSGMITDEVKNGSVNSPGYLVDEQSLTPENNGVPSGKSWMPAYNSTNAPFNATIDLGAVYDITSIALHDMNNVGLLVISTVISGKWQELYKETTDSYNVWRTKEITIKARYLRLTLNESSAAFINEIVLFGTKVKDASVQSNSGYLKPEVSVAEEKTAKQIILSPAMIIDEVSGGSIDSPKYLVDEQNLSIDKKEHAISKSWKPYFNSNMAPYSVTIDLGSEYVLKKISFHDMNNVGPMIISYGEPGNWTVLYTENFNTFNNWLTKEVVVQTRYLRLTQEAGFGAYTNEIMVFGYEACNTGIPVQEKNTAILKSTETPDKSNNTTTELSTDLSGSFNTSKEEIKVYPTIFSQEIRVRIQDEQSEEYSVTLYNLKGQIVAHDKIDHTSSTTKNYSTSEWNLIPGIYIMKISKGISNALMKTFKLIKKA